MNENNTSELGKALAGAFAEIHHAIKNSTNPHFKSTYADLSVVLDTVRVTFSKFNLAIVQLPGPIKHQDGFTTVALTTTIIHSSGQLMSSTMEMPVVATKDGKITPHAVGSAITFGRRYALAAAAGITQADDDGNTATDGGSDDEAAYLDSLRDKITGATSTTSLLALKGEVEEQCDDMLTEYFKARYKKLKGA